MRSSSLMPSMPVLSWWATLGASASSCSRTMSSRRCAALRARQLVLEVGARTCAAAEVVDMFLLRCGCLVERLRARCSVRIDVRASRACVEKSARPQRGRCQRLVNARMKWYPKPGCVWMNCRRSGGLELCTELLTYTLTERSPVACHAPRRRGRASSRRTMPRLCQPSRAGARTL